VAVKSPRRIAVGKISVPRDAGFKAAKNDEDEWCCSSEDSAKHAESSYFRIVANRRRQFLEHY
jgi:hypothetical protein